MLIFPRLLSMLMHMRSCNDTMIRVMHANKCCYQRSSRIRCASNAQHQLTDWASRLQQQLAAGAMHILRVICTHILQLLQQPLMQQLSVAVHRHAQTAHANYCQEQTGLLHKSCSSQRNPFCIEARLNSKSYASHDTPTDCHLTATAMQLASAASGKMWQASPKQTNTHLHTQPIVY
jgi:hypothetical protein